jgi:AcrR family transcriptional regulator
MSLREQKKIRARSDILAAANTLIARKGYASTTMREIADAANVSYQTLYNYFPSKAQIVQAMLTDVERIDTRLATIIAGSDGLVAKLHLIVKHYLDQIAHRERALWREIVLEVIKSAPDYLALQALKGSGSYNVLRTLLQDAQASGELDPYVDADLLAQTLHGISDYAFLRFVLEPNASKVGVLKTLRNQVELLVQPYLRGG